MLFGSFGLYPSYVAGVLNSVKEIHFYVLYCGKLIHADYIEKCIAGEEHSVIYEPHRLGEFMLSSSGEIIALTFEARQFSKTAVVINIRANYFEENMFIVAGLWYCMHQQACDLMKYSRQSMSVCLNVTLVICN